MSAISQSLLFTTLTPTGTTTTVAVVYPNTASSTVTVVSEKSKGDGYYGSSDGLHTVMYAASPSFVGTITMQATLASIPNENDWFFVPSTELSFRDTDIRNDPSVNIYNFTGNFVWVRGHIAFDQGSVFSIQYNN